MDKNIKPKKFDYDITIIGAGTSGLISAYIANLLKAKVCLIESKEMGGDCLNRGCVPSKALIQVSKIANTYKEADKYGIKLSKPKVDFAKVMEYVHKVIKKIAPNDSIERYKSLGIEVIQGKAKLISPYKVEVNNKTITTKKIILATGASPFVPPIKGISDIDYLTSDNIWNLKKLPRKLVIIGGGPIGCELSMAFAKLGSEVIIIERASKILAREDKDVVDIAVNKLTECGIKIITNSVVSHFESVDNIKKIYLQQNNKEEVIEFSHVLVAIGRAANVKGYGLKELGIKLTERKAIKVNEYLQTSKFPNIYALGDAIGSYQFTHTAEHMAWYVAVNSLFGWLKKFKVDYSTIPMVTFLDPEIARVGLNEHEAKIKYGNEIEIIKFDLNDLDRAITEGKTDGFVKLIINNKKLLGATIVAPCAGEMLGQFTLIMNKKLNLDYIFKMIHPYPTYSAANKLAIGVWKKKHIPKFINLLKYFIKFS